MAKTVSYPDAKIVPDTNDVIEVIRQPDGGRFRLSLPALGVPPLTTNETYGRRLVVGAGGALSWQTLVWKDLFGRPEIRDVGATAPSLTTFRGGNTRRLAFGSGDEQDYEFHINHDYAPGTDMFLHIHWAHNGTDISGTMEVTYYATYAKGHNQQAFVPEVTGTISFDTVDIATTPQWQHMITEVQLTDSAPSAAQLDTDDIEVDGEFDVNLVVTGLPSITAGDFFILNCDIHYQAAFDGTLNKAPDFYV